MPAYNYKYFVRKINSNYLGGFNIERESLSIYGLMLTSDLFV